MQASIRLDHTLLAVEVEHTVHVMLELTAPAPGGAAKRPPLRLALALDRSGSMQGEKLETVKRCARWLAGRLEPQDALALIDFDDEVRLLTPLVPGSADAVEKAVARIRPGGMTNLSGGWLKAVEQLRGAEGGARKVLLLTDGLANVGVTDAPTLTTLARTAAAEGITTTTIGVGDGFDEDLLGAMADAAGGHAHYAATADAAPAIFAEEVEGLTSLAAQNLSVEIRPGSSVRLLSVLNSYPAVPVPGGVQLQLGDAYAGERRRVVLALGVPHVDALGVATVADLVVRYVSVGSEVALHELTVPVVVNLVSADEAAAAAPDLQVQEEVLILQAARAREDAIRQADAGDLDAARSTLRAASQALRAAPPMAADPTALAAQADELDASLNSLDDQGYNAAQRKRLYHDARRHGRRRS